MTWLWLWRGLIDMTIVTATPHFTTFPRLPVVMVKSCFINTFFSCLATPLIRRVYPSSVATTEIAPIRTGPDISMVTMDPIMVLTRFIAIPAIIFSVLILSSSIIISSLALVLVLVLVLGLYQEIFPSSSPGLIGTG